MRERQAVKVYVCVYSCHLTGANQHIISEADRTAGGSRESGDGEMLSAVSPSSWALCHFCNPRLFAAATEIILK